MAPDSTRTDVHTSSAGTHLALPHGRCAVGADGGVELGTAHHDGAEAKGEAHGSKQRLEHAHVDLPFASAAAAVG